MLLNAPVKTLGTFKTSVRLHPEVKVDVGFTIARSLVTNPSLLMLDEPFSGVDPIAVYDVQQIIQDLRAQGLAILITDHNVRETLNIVDRAYLIFEGRVESQGTKDFLLNDPISRKLYLGENFQM